MSKLKIRGTKCTHPWSLCKFETEPAFIHSLTHSCAWRGGGHQLQAPHHRSNLVLTNGLDPNGGPNTSSEGMSQQSVLNNLGKEGAYLSLLAGSSSAPLCPFPLALSCDSPSSGPAITDCQLLRLALTPKHTLGLSRKNEEKGLCQRFSPGG